MRHCRHKSMAAEPSLETVCWESLEPGGSFWPQPSQMRSSPCCIPLVWMKWHYRCGAGSAKRSGG